MRWTPADMPDLSGRRAIVTGANSGIGFWTALALAQHGAQVTLAVRDPAKGEAAAADIRQRGGHDVQVGHLDLASLASVRDFADTWGKDHTDGLDLLINNAGVMAIPRSLSTDGYEMQLATNYLGHFALTGLLLPALTSQPQARVVNVSSNAHKMTKGIDFEDLMGERHYRAWRAYGQSKLAILLFTSELQRHLDLLGSSIKIMAAHPGAASTDLYLVSSRLKQHDLVAGITAKVMGVVGQSPQMGALPTLFAATAPDLPGNSYIGPDQRFQWQGYPRVVDRSTAAKDADAARRLWLLSEELTSVQVPID
ncbi:MAG: oxidoreductase [Candidatus Nanopelagicales bacterium]